MLPPAAPSMPGADPGVPGRGYPFIARRRHRGTGPAAGLAPRVHTGVVAAASVLVIGPLIAFAVIAVFGLVLRWAFDGQTARNRMNAPDDDYGLLAVVGTVENMRDAEALRDMLVKAGIRATLAPAPGAYVRVLVFRRELDRARRMVGRAAP